MPGKRLIVVDASALGAVFFNETASANALPMLAGIRRGEIEAAAPSLCIAEFNNVCRKKIEKLGVSANEVDQVQVDFDALPVVYLDIDRRGAAAWELYRTHSPRVETYDAFYLDLALLLGADLWTADARFARAAGPVHRDKVFDLNQRVFG